MSSTQSCSNCIFYFPVTLSTGYCKAAPPMPVHLPDPPEHGHIEYPWPVMNAAEAGCGSWRGDPTLAAPR